MESETRRRSIIKSIISHSAFESVYSTISDAIGLAELGEESWTASTRDGLVHQIEGKIPALDKGYNLLHLVRSLSYVFKLQNIPCDNTYCEMSSHTKMTIKILGDVKIKPIVVMEYFRANGINSPAPASMLPDDIMVLSLVLCQAMAILCRIKEGKSHVYDHWHLAAFNALKKIYVPARGTIGEGDIGIEHAAPWAYDKLSNWLKPTFRAREVANSPFGFLAWMGPVEYSDWFVDFMKALLVSRIIEKAPLSNANDIRGLCRAKDAFEAKGYEGKDLVKLLIITQRLWTPKRMAQFAENIHAASVAAPAAVPAAAAPAAATAAAAPAAATADGDKDEEDVAGFMTPVPLSQRNSAVTAATAPVAAHAAAETACAAGPCDNGAAASYTSIAELAARLPPSPQAGYDLPPYAAAVARTQAARSEDEDNATYRGRHFRSLNSEVGDLIDIEAKESSHSPEPESESP